MLTSKIHGARTLLLTTTSVLCCLLAGPIVVSAVYYGDLTVTGIITTIITITAYVWISLYTYMRALKPTKRLLQNDIRRLANVFNLDEFYRKDYATSNVVSYYASTTFRDYELLAFVTGSNAMHSQLNPIRSLPYSCGHLKQLLYIIAQLGDAVRGGKVLEVGSGKGSNSVYLADLFPEAHFMGIDLVEEHVTYANEYAKARGIPNVVFSRDNASDPSNITQAAGLFDVIFGIESFCHIVDSEECLSSFMSFAMHSLKPGGRLVIVDGFRSECFDQVPKNVQQAMMLAESGFRVRAMTPKSSWRSLASATGLHLIDDSDLTAEVLPFWTLGWKVAHTILAFPPWILRTYIESSSASSETGANFVSVAMTAYAMSLGSAEYGVLVFKKSDQETWEDKPWT